MRNIIYTLPWSSLGAEEVYSILRVAEWLNTNFRLKGTVHDTKGLSLLEAS